MNNATNAASLPEANAYTMPMAKRGTGFQGVSIYYRAVWERSTETRKLTVVRHAWFAVRQCSDWRYETTKEAPSLEAALEAAAKMGGDTANVREHHADASGKPWPAPAAIGTVR